MVRRPVEKRARARCGAPPPAVLPASEHTRLAHGIVASRMPPGSEAMALPKHGTHVVDDMQRLRENDAIELRALYPDGAREIGHHRRSWIGVVEIDDLGCASRAIRRSVG